MKPRIKKTRVLHILNKMDRGGAETWLMHILRHIDRERYCLDFMVHDPKPGAYDAEARSLGAKIIYCPYPKNPLTYARDFKRILNDNAYDIIHSHLIPGGFHIFWAKQLGVPAGVVHSHTDELVHLETLSFIQQIFIQISYQLMKRYANAGIAASYKAAEGRFGSNWKLDSRWRILYCGIDLAEFKQRLDKKKMRRDLGIPEDALVIGHVGNFSPVKNHSFIIDIMNHIKQLEPNFQVLFVGDGSLRPSIEQIVSNFSLNDHSIFLGVREDIPNLMMGVMDVFLLPSMYEGLPITLLEAQAAGLPIILSDNITKELQVVDKLIIPLPLSKGALEWAKQILAVNDIRKTIIEGESISLLEESKFNIKYSCNQLVNLYDKLVK